MTRFIFAIASLFLLAMVYIAESRTCQDAGGWCDSENDCNSGICGDDGRCADGDGSRRTIKAHSVRLGDIKFREGSTRSGLIGEQYRWPDANFTYELHPSFTADELKLIHKAFDEIGGQTCLTFVPRTNENDYVYYNRGYGLPCDSQVGRQGGKQILNLGVAKNEGDGDCMNVETIAHETLHALGFEHEMNRYDRDDYVTVNWDNIACANKFSFWKENSTTTDTFGVPYDYESIMHYGTHEGGIDPDVPVLIPKQKGAKLGRLGATKLSQYDVLSINRMYKCITG